MKIKYKYVRMIMVRAFCEDQYGESICKKRKRHMTTPKE